MKEKEDHRHYDMVLRAYVSALVKMFLVKCFLKVL